MAFGMRTAAVAPCVLRAGARRTSLVARPRPCAALAAPRRVAPRAGGYRLYTAAELAGDAPKAEAAAEAAEAAPASAASAPLPLAAAATPPAFAPAPDAGFLGAAQELMNGRAAMLGFAIAVGVELSTGKGVASQLFDTVTQKATLTQTHALDAVAWMEFALVVIMVTMGTLAPTALSNDTGAAAAKRATPAGREHGIFTAAAEMQNARAAMLGFVALLATEAVKGSALF